jgi:hypothetical protein
MSDMLLPSCDGAYHRMQLYCAVGRATHSAHMSFHRTGNSGQAAKPSPFLQPFLEPSLKNDRFKPLVPTMQSANSTVDSNVSAHDAPFEQGASILRA